MSPPTQIQHCRGCSCHDAPQSVQDMQQLVDLVKTAHSATAAMAEVVRAQSQAIIAVVERNNPIPHPATPTLAPPKTKPCSTMVISERVGSISIEQWEGMSEDSLLELDRVLKVTINTTMLRESGWEHMAGIVRNELAAIGLVFNTVDQCHSFDASSDWRVAKNKLLSDIVRMRALASASRPIKDGNQWWVDEMMRVVLRLMELRGM